MKVIRYFKFICFLLGEKDELGNYVASEKPDVQQAKNENEYYLIKVQEYKELKSGKFIPKANTRAYAWYGDDLPPKMFFDEAVPQEEEMLMEEEA